MTNDTDVVHMVVALTDNHTVVRNLPIADPNSKNGFKTISFTMHNAFAIRLAKQVMQTIVDNPELFKKHLSDRVELSEIACGPDAELFEVDAETRQ